jgi:hypothetical protein
MCCIIVIDKGEKEIGTPAEFQEHFGYLPEKEEYYDTLDLTSCLCQCDLDKTFSDNNIPYVVSWGDYYIGDITDIVD